MLYIYIYNISAVVQSFLSPPILKLVVVTGTTTVKVLECRVWRKHDKG
jgi:hypothetical protein